jgi:hypothetical protein
MARYVLPSIGQAISNIEKRHAAVVLLCTDESALVVWARTRDEAAAALQSVLQLAGLRVQEAMPWRSGSAAGPHAAAGAAQSLPPDAAAEAGDDGDKLADFRMAIQEAQGPTPRGSGGRWQERGRARGRGPGRGRGGREGRARHSQGAPGGAAEGSATTRPPWRSHAAAGDGAAAESGAAAVPPWRSAAATRARVSAERGDTGPQNSRRPQGSRRQRSEEHDGSLGEQGARS